MSRTDKFYVVMIRLTNVVVVGAVTITSLRHSQHMFDHYDSALDIDHIVTA